MDWEYFPQRFLKEACPKTAQPHRWTELKGCRCVSCGDWDCLDCGAEVYAEYPDEGKQECSDQT